MECTLDTSIGLRGFTPQQKGTQRPKQQSTSFCYCRYPHHDHDLHLRKPVNSHNEICPDSKKELLGVWGYTPGYVGKLLGCNEFTLGANYKWVKIPMILTQSRTQRSGGFWKFQFWLS